MWGETGRVGALEARGEGGPRGWGGSPLPAVEWQLQIPCRPQPWPRRGREARFLPPSETPLAHLAGFGAAGCLWALLEQDELGSERREGSPPAARASASPPVTWTQEG